MLIPHQSLGIKPKHVITGILNYILRRKSYSDLNKLIPLKHRYWTSSGRNALKIILKQTKARNVGIPSFTCEVLDIAIKESNCSPIYFDSKEVVDIKEITQIIKKIDTLVLPYNFGFLPEIDKILILCKKHKVTLIEDCCAALGSEYKERLTGTFGNYSIYSFGIGKTGFLGGMIGSNNELVITKQKSYPITSIIKILLISLFNKAIFNPYIYPIFHKSLNKTIKQKQPNLEYSFPKIAEYIVLEILKDFEQVNNQRRENAKILIQELSGIIDFVKTIENSKPSWLYFVFKTNNRENFMKDLLKEHVEMIPLLDYKDLSKVSPKATLAKDKHLTFALARPKSQIEYAVKKIKKLCENGNY